MIKILSSFLSVHDSILSLTARTPATTPLILSRRRKREAMGGFVVLQRSYIDLSHICTAAQKLNCCDCELEICQQETAAMEGLQL
jgi:hypothetical protein